MSKPAVVINPAQEIDVLLEGLAYLYHNHGPDCEHGACEECCDRAVIIRLLMKRFAKAETMTTWPVSRA